MRAVIESVTGKNGEAKEKDRYGRVVDVLQLKLGEPMLLLYVEELYKGKYLRTSRVKSIGTMPGNKVKVSTKNSIYTLGYSDD